MFENLAGNQQQYNVENVQKLATSPLEGMRILYLGSSITVGYGSLNTSYADYIAKRNGTTFVKEAVSGTCLVDDKADSYVSRLHTVDVNDNFDMFVCQLSTNDFSKFKTIGNVNDADTKTVCGAINHIVDYVRKTWGCTVVFYSCHNFHEDRYAEMVNDLLQIAQKKNFYVIDLYNDKQFNDITDQQRSLYMADNMHPTKAGYLLWWTPTMEKHLYEIVKAQQK